MRAQNYLNSAFNDLQTLRVKTLMEMFICSLKRIWGNLEVINIFSNVITSDLYF